MAQNYVFGSIHPVGYINEFSLGGPMKFQGRSTDKNLLPKKAQIPFITNGSECRFIDDMSLWVYNLSDDDWYPVSSDEIPMANTESF